MMKRRHLRLTLTQETTLWSEVRFKIKGYLQLNVTIKSMVLSTDKAELFTKYNLPFKKTSVTHLVCFSPSSF